jgi:hypothetical protein
MPELFRTRDVIILFKGDTYTCAVDTNLGVSGWLGGQGCQWETPSRDEFLVSASDGLYAGFFLWGSDESSDQFTSMTLSQPTYHYAVIGAGGWLISTSTYERYTWLSRTGGGPLVPIAYKESDRLMFSLRGYWTKEDEWTLANDPRKPNNYYIAFVAQAPSSLTNGYMTIQTSI